MIWSWWHCFCLSLPFQSGRPVFVLGRLSYTELSATRILIPLPPPHLDPTNQPLTLSRLNAPETNINHHTDTLILIALGVKRGLPILLLEGWVGMCLNRAAVNLETRMTPCHLHQKARISEYTPLYYSCFFFSLS